MKKIVENILYPIFVILIILLFWYIIALVINVDLILPSPANSFNSLKALIIEKEFWISLGYTFLRSIESFLLAFLVALLLSVISYIFKKMEKVINPLMAFIRSIPTMSIILILVISLSPSSVPITVACIVICPTLYQSFLTGFKQMDEKLVEMVNVYKVPKIKQITKFYIPNMLPTILDNSATGFSLNIKLIIAAEALAQTKDSIGKLMQYAKINIEVERLFALTIVAVILGVLCEFLLKLLKKVVCRFDRAN